MKNQIYNIGILDALWEYGNSQFLQNNQGNNFRVFCSKYEISENDWVDVKSLSRIITVSERYITTPLLLIKVEHILERLYAILVNMKFLEIVNQDNISRFQEKIQILMIGIERINTNVLLDSVNHELYCKKIKMFDFKNWNEIKIFKEWYKTEV